MCLGFFTFEACSRRLVFHDGDHGGFSSELLIDAQDDEAAILVVNTTGTPAPAASHAVSNTEPDAGTDPRVALRRVSVDEVFGGR